MEPSFIRGRIEVVLEDTRLPGKLVLHLHKGQLSLPLISMEQKTGQIALARFVSNHLK